MIYRVYTEKKTAFALEAASLLKELRELLGCVSVSGLRLLNRYDVEGISEDLFRTCLNTVFSEPPVDDCFFDLPGDASAVLASEYLPGQFDQRADSCAQCIQFVSGGERPRVRTARLYLLYGNPSPAELEAIKKHLINPVESRLAALDLPATLTNPVPPPAPVPLIEGFLELDKAGRAALMTDYGLAMDDADLAFCQQYFREEQRCPTLTELRVIDTYWSDHCRHTTFSTQLDNIGFADERAAAAYARYQGLREQLKLNKPVTLMDMATIGARYLYAQGQLPAWDKSEEVNACTVRVEVDADGQKQPWLLLFKNETHNHPTEIEPFGGAATCLGGAIRDPLSGRGFAYQAMRVSGAADPTAPLSETLPGKLPQRQLTTKAAAGYSSYGNQIGLATGLVREHYHSGYMAKRLEAGAVLAAAPAANVRREQPQAGDVVILVGGRTGRDGCGGATGSSKAHDADSLVSLGAEVQKGNAPEERKLQRLFRNPEAAKLIKRCNDFGAGGVAVAIGELADGLDINLDAVPKKYAGLDGTELAISESQERMAVVLDRNDVAAFCELAARENLESTMVALVSEQPRLVMHWQDQTIVNITREFLDSNGAPKHHTASVRPGQAFAPTVTGDNLNQKLRALVGDLNVCSQRGLTERFDSTVGAGTVLMPFGGACQQTPTQAMAAKLPLASGETTTCSLMSHGYNPYIAVADPYAGAYLAVVESVAKLIAGGGNLSQCWLSLQEYFPKLGQDPERWGLPVAALLGALSAQLDLGLAAIGGKDSMSGSFEQLDVPPALISFAVSLAESGHIVSPEFKRAGSRVALIAPNYDANGLPEPASLRECFDTMARLIRENKVSAAYTPVYGGLAEGLFKMCLGNSLGLNLTAELSDGELFGPRYGAFIVELTADAGDIGQLLAHTIAAYQWQRGDEIIPLDELEQIYEGRLEGVFPCQAPTPAEEIPAFSFAAERRVAPRVGNAKPRVLIPAFPGTNCEYDTARAFEKAGAQAEIVVVRNLTPDWLAASVEQVAAAVAQAQIVALPGGFSGGDEPDGSGKFIANFFRHPRLTEAIMSLLSERDGLMCGICNGFQALIKLGLLPHGYITGINENSPTLTFNAIGRHQSKLINKRVASNLSPWLSLCQVGDIHTVAISHGEGRFVCDEQQLRQLAAQGQIASQYVDLNGQPTMDVRYNPNGSYMAVEAITSPDGRVFGQMGHPERWGQDTLQNVPGNKDYPVFAGAVHYFK